MNYQNYIIEFSSAGRTDLDHTGDMFCKVFHRHPDGTPQAEILNSFIITGGEIHDYGSAEAAVMAYMRRKFPDNEVQDIQDYRQLLERQRELQGRMKQLAERLLARHGGRITSYPEPDEYGGMDYPVTIIFYGKYGTQDINITAIYLDADGRLRADGIDDRNGTIEKNFEVPSEHYAGAIAFLAFALGIK